MSPSEQVWRCHRHEAATPADDMAPGPAGRPGSGGVGILAAAAALRQFTAAQLAAYCAEDEAAVSAFLSGQPELWEWLPEACEWRVVDLAGIRALLAAAAGPDPPAAPPPWTPAGPAAPADRLLFAEDLLLACGPDPAADRTAAARTALNHLRQFIAAVRPVAGPWWRINLAGRVAIPDLPLASGDLVTTARVRIDIALAHLIGAEAAGRRASARQLISLISAAWDVECLPESMDAERWRDLDERFTALCRKVLDPPGRAGGTSAPATFLAALALLRAPDRARHSSAGGEVLARLLDGLSRVPTVADHAAVSPFFRVLDRRPDGLRRLAVYSGLLPLVPRGGRWRQESEPLPGVVVEAVVDDVASRHLEDSAWELARGLSGFPEPSLSALIGQASYVLDEVASRRATLDSDVISRSEPTRKELLSLGNVLV